MKTKHLMVCLASSLLALLAAGCCSRAPQSPAASNVVTINCCSVNLAILQNGQPVTNECVAWVGYAGGNMTARLTNHLGDFSIPIHAAPGSTGVYLTGNDNASVPFYWTTQMAEIAASTNFIINVEQCQR